MLAAAYSHYTTVHQHSIATCALLLFFLLSATYRLHIQRAVVLYTPVRSRHYHGRLILLTSHSPPVVGSVLASHLSAADADGLLVPPPPPPLLQRRPLPPLLHRLRHLHPLRPPPTSTPPTHSSTHRTSSTLVELTLSLLALPAYHLLSQPLAAYIVALVSASECSKTVLFFLYSAYDETVVQYRLMDVSTWDVGYVMAYLLPSVCWIIFPAWLMYDIGGQFIAAANAAGDAGRGKRKEQ